MKEKIFAIPHKNLAIFYSNFGEDRNTKGFSIHMVIQF